MLRRLLSLSRYVVIAAVLSALTACATCYGSAQQSG